MKNEPHRRLAPPTTTESAREVPEPLDGSGRAKGVELWLLHAESLVSRRCSVGAGTDVLSHLQLLAPPITPVRGVVQADLVSSTPAVREHVRRAIRRSACRMPHAACRMPAEADLALMSRKRTGRAVLCCSQPADGRRPGAYFRTSTADLLGHYSNPPSTLPNLLRELGLTRDKN